MEVERIRSSIGGLDLAIGGGFLKGSTILVLGGPGTGKTVFCLQYIVRGAEEGEPGVFVTLEELPAQLVSEAHSLGLDLEGRIGRDIQLVDCVSERIGLAPPFPFAVRKDQFSFDAILERIGKAVDSIGAVRIAIDPIGPLLRAAGPGQSVEEVVLRLGGFLWHKGLTSLLTATKEQENLGYITQGIIRLEQSEIEEGGRLRRRRLLRVVKMRGTKCSDQVLEYHIDWGGIQLTT